jgi:hypothetical protein
VIEEIKIQGEKMQYVRTSLQEKILLAKVLIIFRNIFAWSGNNNFLINITRPKRNFQSIIFKKDTKDRTSAATHRSI